MSRLDEISTLVTEWKVALASLNQTEPRTKTDKLLMLVAEELVEHKHRLAGMGFMTGEPI